MAGRGTDIQLGGNLDEKNKDNKYLEKLSFDKNRVMKNGGLYVIGTERHESRRIDNQLEEGLDDKVTQELQNSLFP